MDPYVFDQRIAVGLDSFSPPENSGLSFVSPSASSPLVLAGVDEAGRGPLAGPVVAAAVILPSSPQIPGLNDSKKLTPHKREILYAEIQKIALASAVSIVSHEVIDSINILAATLHAMREALKNLRIPPGLVLVDGNQKPGGPLPQRTIVKGDGHSACIMAASILAKVTRDRLMRDLHEIYPQYGFDTHKGYGAASHIEALKKFGPSPVHRRTFEPVKSMGGEDGRKESVGISRGRDGVKLSEEPGASVARLERENEVG